MTDPEQQRAGLLDLAGPLLVGVAAALVAAAVLSTMTGADRPGPEGLLAVLVLTGVAMLLVALPGMRPIPALVGAAGIWVLAVGSVKFLLHDLDPGDPVSSGVGAAAYNGSSYVGAQIAAAATVGAVVAAAGAIAVLARRARTSPLTRLRSIIAPTSADGDPVASQPRASRRDVLILVAGVAAVALTIVPDLQTLSIQNALEPVPYDFDAANVAVWQGLVDRGLVPIKDFFYPYGFQWVVNLYPWGPTFRWLVETALLALAAWSLWRLSGGRVWRVVLCLIGIALVGAWTPLVFGLPGVWRYMPALLIGLTYGAIGPARHPLPTRGHLVFGATCLLAALLEGDLILYGLIGAALVLAGDLVSGWLPWRPRAIARGLLVDALVVAIAIAAVVLVWALTGTLEGNLRFFGGLRALSAVAAFDTGQLTPPLEPSKYSLYLAVPALLVGAGLALALLTRDPLRARGAAAILLTGGGVSFLLLIKHLSRQVPEALLVVPLLALVWSAILLWRRETLIATAVAVWIAIGIVFLQQSHTVTDYLGDAVKSPYRAGRSLLLPTKSDQLDAVEAQLYAPARFAPAGWADIPLSQDLRAVAGGKARPAFAVLGDSPILYLLLDQDPPYQTELYDAAPISQQRAVVDALEREDPRFVILPHTPSVDDVPYAVRDPLVFAWAVPRYVPARRGKQGDILRMRRAGEPVAIGYWRHAIGTVNLSYIPSFSRGDEAPSCSGGPGCVPYATMGGGSPVQGEELRIRVRGRGHAFTVSMRARDGVTSYAVRLDRLWFARLVGPHPRIDSATPGWTTRIQGRRAGDDLY